MTLIEKLSSISAASLKPIVNASSLPNTNDAVKKNWKAKFEAQFVNLYYKAEINENR